ncbi:MAG: cell division protein FtsZ [Paludibacteraceae bacterium]|jgi:cell division protein FtsZ|nr:cell division protein FtsZ [Paludibacteraceae bacterium]
MYDVINDLGLEVSQDTIIKVMGVGGGGCNAVNYMFSQGIKDVTFLVCNTDKQALGRSSIPAKLQLGPGLGAGGRPEVAQEYAEQNRERIREALNDGTKMLFLTAGMGGGTGTGASSVVAEVAREMDILTVGIVTIPFAFEGTKKIKKAMTGVAQLAEHVDAILVINNEKLREIYPDFTFLNAFSKSDDVVANAARSIAEIITVPGIINTDFTDVFNTLSNSNVAIMSVGSASGEDRINQSIHEALTSPLVNSDVKGAKRVLLQLYCSSEHPIIMQEFDHIHAFVHAMGDEVEVQWGVSLDENLGEKVRVTLIATGFEVSDIPGLDDAVGKKTVDQAIEKFYGESNAGETIEDTPEEPVAAPTEELTIQDSDVIINLDEDLLPSTPIADNHPRPVTPEPTREDATWSRSGIAGWMRGRR